MCKTDGSAEEAPDLAEEEEPFWKHKVDAAEQLSGEDFQDRFYKITWYKKHAKKP